MQPVCLLSCSIRHKHFVQILEKSGKPRGYNSRELTKTPSYVYDITLYRISMFTDDKSMFFEYGVYIYSEE